MIRAFWELILALIFGRSKVKVPLRSRTSLKLNQFLGPLPEMTLNSVSKFLSYFYSQTDR